MSETVTPNNVQDFSDNDVLDNFGEGPEATPMGLGGEAEKQAEPASSTLEADIVNGVKPEVTPEVEVPGTPPEEAVNVEPEPVAEEQVPETPEFPPALLQMAGYATPEQAKEAGFDPGSLLAAVQWRGKILGPEPVVETQEGSLYRPKAPEQTPVEEETGFKPFKPENADMLDEELLAVLKQQSEHFDKQLQQQQEQFASELQERDTRTQAAQDREYESRFDQTVSGLGEEWQDVFGKGDAHKLSSAGQSDPAAMTAYNHRVMLFSAVEAVREANEKQGFAPMDLGQEVQWALMQRYPDKFQQQFRRTQERRGIQTSRPTARKIPLGSSNDRILSAVDARLRAKGSPGLDMGQDDEFDGEI